MPESSSVKPLERVLGTLLSVTTTLAALAALAWFASYFYTLVAMLGLVMIMTYILLGPVNLMEWGILFLSGRGHRLGWYHQGVHRSPDVNPRIVAVVIVFTIFMMSMVYGAVRFLPELGRQVTELGEAATEQVAEKTDTAIRWVDRHTGQGTIKRMFRQDIEAARNEGTIRRPSPSEQVINREERQVIRETVFRGMIDQVEKFLGDAAPNVIGLATSTLNGFVYLLVGLLLIFYFLVDGHKFKPAIMNMLPDQEARRTTAELLDSFHMVMFAFIKGQVMLGVLTGIYMFIIYKIFHVPYAFLLGVIFAIAELLPVVGTWIGIIIGLTVILLNPDQLPPITALYVWLCSYAYQSIKDNILAPKVVGDVMGLHPLAIIMALMICAQLMGLLGVLLALPLASMINVVVCMLLRRDAVEDAAKEASA